MKTLHVRFSMLALAVALTLGGCGSGGSSTSNAPAPVDSACGSANGSAFASAPSTNLCTTGTASSVSGTGPWTWSCTGSGGGTTASCSASVSTSATYDVAARVAQLPLTVTLPTSPTTSTTVSVSDSMQLSTELAAGAKRINCIAGSTFAGPVTITQNDTVLDMTGCTITGTGANVLNLDNRLRIKVVGGSWAGGWTANNATDIHIYDAVFTASAAGGQSSVANATRVLFEHSTNTMSLNTQILMWGAGASHFVVANSILRHLVGGNATWRAPSCQNCVVMDSFLQNPMNHNLRVATGAGSGGVNIYWGRNLIDGGALGDNQNVGNITNLWIVDNEIRHGNCCSSFAIDNTSPGVSGAITNRVTSGNSLQTWQGNMTDYFENGPISGTKSDTNNTYLPNATWVPVSSTYWNGTGTYQ